MRYAIENTRSGQVLGIYEAPSPAAALDAMAQEAGYASYDDLQDQVPAQPGEIIVYPVWQVDDLDQH
jgi:hypothetical protein